MKNRVENRDVGDSMVFAEDKNDPLELTSWLVQGGGAPVSFPRILGGGLSEQNLRDTGHLHRPLALRMVTNY